MIYDRPPITAPMLHRLTDEEILSLDYTTYHRGLGSPVEVRVLPVDGSIIYDEDVARVFEARYGQPVIVGPSLHRETCRCCGNSRLR